MNPTNDSDQVVQFTKNITTWRLDKVLDYFAYCMNDNDFSKRGDEIDIVRAEIHRRSRI
jgi:hypothetical protein